MRLICVLIGAMATAIPIQAQSRSDSLVSHDWQAMADSTIGSSVDAGTAPGAVVVVVNRSSTVFSAGFGFADLSTKRAVTDSTLFEVGSIGKVLTAISVLQLAERGSLDLSTDINAYLTSLRVDPPRDTRLTLHHLLTHSGGLNERAIGYARRNPADVPPLGEFLRSNIPTFYSEPGRYISYSNYGFGLAGLAVEETSGRPFVQHVDSEILEPLGIRRSGYGSQKSLPGKAVGYTKDGDNFVPLRELYRPVTPAGSFVASAGDMGILIRALLNNGSGILMPESAALMTETQQRMHPALMGNSYGLEESRWGNVTGYGKGGSIPGFTAYMVLLPEHDLALFAAVNTSDDAALDAFVVAVLQKLSRGPAATLSALVDVDPSRFVGEYRSNRYDRTTIEKLLNFEVHQVYAGDDSGLRMWHDGGWSSYRPVGETLFQNVDDPQRMLSFESAESGAITRAFFNDRIGGGYVPVVWEKNGFFGSNQYVNEYFGIVLLIGLSYLLFPIVALMALGFRRRRRPLPTAVKDSLRRWRNLSGLVTSALLMLYVLLYFIPLLRSRSELLFGVPDTIARFEFLSIPMLAGFATFTILWLVSMGKPTRAGIRWAGLGYGLVFITSGILIAEFCVRWNLI